MPFWKCYYHIVWTTKHRQPCITPAYEAVIQAAIHDKSLEYRCSIMAINMVTDHIHVAVSIPPGVAVSKWVGGVKGASARAINTGFEREERFHWQAGYGVMSFGEKNLLMVQDYIASQKEHHSTGSVNSYLECVEDD
ncbi:MAG: IS200/IS605 family transposase [Chloroflexi bacterium]|nr:IS200/IS605 family transposase [Chloroflexota bacterium]